jgi:uncharacterized protein
MRSLLRYLFIFSFVFLCPISGEEVQPHVTLFIPMRDGVKLETDLYLPAPEAKNLPCILLRNPAGRNAFGKEIIELTKFGYAVAIQDTRNVLDKEGKSFPFVSDGCGKLQDGYDTVEWLAKSPYTNGRIGTWGPSALGITQLMMAPSNPPHLQCQYILMAAPSLYHHAAFLGGQFLKNQVEEWLKCYAKHPDVLQNICHRYTYDDFWGSLNSLEGTLQVTVPAIFVSGWYDTFLEGTLSAFVHRQAEGGNGAKNRQKLVIGPWTHAWPKSTKLGDFETPSTAIQAPVDISPKTWFDHHLKNIPLAAPLATVTYYVMGPFEGSSSKGNQWKTSPVWPVASSSTSFYLTSDAKLQKTNAEGNPRKIEYDPHDPVPTIGGHNLFIEAGPKDQRPIENRSDVLVFTSENMMEDLEVTGTISAILYVQSNCNEYDVCLRICDVYPDGRSILISEGLQRMTTLEKQKSNEINKVEVIASPTSFVFAKGHSIRLSVSNSNYPRYENSHGLYPGVDQKCSFTIYMNKDHPSQLVLPVVTSEN